MQKGNKSFNGVGLLMADRTEYLQKVEIASARAKLRLGAADGIERDKKSCTCLKCNPTGPNDSTKPRS